MFVSLYCLNTMTLEALLRGIEKLVLSVKIQGERGRGTHEEDAWEKLKRLDNK